MSLKGIKEYSSQDPSQRSAFRTSWFAPEGAVGAYILEGQVFDYNLNNWTVDVATKFDQKRYRNIQVGSPYQHFNRGEGLYIFPDIGAKCHICIPSEGSPPYLQDFIMPMETIDQAGTEETPDGTDGPKMNPSTSTFAGGRTRAKPGDIIMRGRDGNFCILHKGGVLQIGATSLAQRLYIPLQNLITDISQNYDHLNTGGSMRWFVSNGESDTNPSTIYKHTFRLRAGEENGSIRISVGKLSDVVPEIVEEVKSDMLQLGMDPATVPTLCEVVYSPEGFGASSGELETDASKNTVLRYLFDEDGNFMLRTVGNIYVRAKTLRVRLQEDMQVFGRNFALNFTGVGRIQATGALDIVGQIIKFNGGKAPIATAGSTTTSQIPPGTTFQALIPPAPAPVLCTIIAAPPIPGIVDTGNPSLLG